MTRMPMRVAVFICSSDSRRDVLDRVLPSISKFWPGCPYPIYVGLNSHDHSLPVGIPVVAPPSEWHRECATQLTQIEEDYVIVILDDYLITTPVNQARLTHLVQEAFMSGLPYLRLLPLGRSLPARLVGWRHAEVKEGIEWIHAGRPFYSSLQIAMWCKQHLLSMLQTPLTVWEFEHHSIPGSTHCAIKDDPPIVYRHLVERGRWLPYARPLLQRTGLATELGERPVWPKSRYARLLLDQVRWSVLGYANW